MKQSKTTKAKSRQHSANSCTCFWLQQCHK